MGRCTKEIFLGHTPQCLETQQAFDKLCEEYRDIFSIHQGARGHTKLHTMDIERGDYPPIAQKHYTMAIKLIQWV